METTKPYEEDLILLKSLNLKPFSAKHAEETLVGTYTNEEDDYSIDIYVTCLPAQFFRCMIKSNDLGSCRIETGSGTLTSYWPSIKLIAEGMISVQKI